VNQVTSEGLPVLFIKDLPPVSTVSIKVTRPQIYYGELTNSYVFVGTGQKEFDYPAGDKNVYTNYTGRGGVPVGSLLRRALFAWQLGSTDIVLSSYLSGDARILYRRNIGERARAALPFLTFDGEPYLIVTDSGALKWILDAYTSSDAWPYSQPADSRSTPGRGGSRTTRRESWARLLPPCGNAPRHRDSLADGAPVRSAARLGS
jgi:uncharacterized membrane protein (UPF0182 family)